MMDMNSTTATRKAARAYDAAITSLADAEALMHLLAANMDPSNNYMVDALIRATELVVEMESNLDAVMSEYSPEDCGL